jgi:hypothetical protein
MGIERNGVAATFIWLLVCEAQAKEASKNGFDKGSPTH